MREAALCGRTGWQRACQAESARDANSAVSERSGTLVRLAERAWQAVAIQAPFHNADGQHVSLLM